VKKRLANKSKQKMTKEKAFGEMILLVKNKKMQKLLKAKRGKVVKVKVKRLESPGANVS